MRALCPPMLVLTLATTPAMAERDTGMPRHLLEAMDISRPQATASAFVAAYSKSDYFAASYLLTFDVSTSFHSAMMSRDGAGLLFPRSPRTVGSAVVHTLDGPYMSEQVLDFAVFFDKVMYQAELTGVLPFTLRQDADIASAMIEGGTIAIIDGGPTLHLVQTRPGRWLVDRIEVATGAGWSPLVAAPGGAGGTSQPAPDTRPPDGHKDPCCG